MKPKDLEAFEKFYGINIPDRSDFDYYIETLMKSSEYADLTDKIKEFCLFEQWIEERGLQNVGEYKMGPALHTLKKYISETKAYEEFNSFDYSKNKFFTVDEVKKNAGNIFVSIDFSNANYNTIKTFDKSNELKESWPALVESLQLHPIMSTSKKFRQIVFGVMNPNRNQKIQHLMMTGIHSEFSKIGLEKNAIFLSNDEIVLMDVKDKMDVVGDIVNRKSEELHMPMKTTQYQLSKIAKNVYLKTIYDGHPNLKYNTLYGCPKDKFYMLFKKHVICEDVNSRDLKFYMDGNLAQWII